MSFGNRGDPETQSGRRGKSKVENRNSEAGLALNFYFRFSIFVFPQPPR